MTVFGKRRQWDETGEEDPAAGLLNLFDVWIAFAAALLIGVVGTTGASRLARPGERPGGPPETVDERRVALDRFRPTDETLGGEGERLGTAYRLSTGEVVYVPEGNR